MGRLGWMFVCSLVALSEPRLASQAPPAPAIDRACEQAPAGELPTGLSARDWSGIREAHQAFCYGVVATADGCRARNPGQRWLTSFDGRGFTVHPDAVQPAGSGWTWGLQLERYGFQGSECAVTTPVPVAAAGARVSCDRDEALQEWYVNDARGLEHGFTLRQRPPRDASAEDAPLSFILSVRGDLVPRVQDGGRGVCFVDGADAAVVTYAGLAAFDADGRPLAARLERCDDGLRLSVDERGARYPLTIDPIAQQAYLKASNTNVGDQFGWSVAVSGNTVVVGAPFEASAATGVNGNQADNSAFAAGAAYVFVRNGATWSQQAYLKASNAGAVDEFGTAVAVSGDTVLVSAVLEASAATGVNGNQADNSAGSSGAAYVFVRSGTSWSQQAYLKASNTESMDWFGFSAALAGDTAVVGAELESSNATGVNGDQANNTAGTSGAAYVFVRSGSTWSQQAYLKASNTDPGDAFGRAVAVSGDTVVVGAITEDSAADSVNGDGSNNTAGSAGAAYVFVRSGSSWSQQAYLKASNSDALDQFGNTVSVSGDTVVVGAPGEDSNATGVNGDQSNQSGGGSGAAYVFTRSGSTWSQQAYLKASNTDLNDTFGGAVSVSGNIAVIGAVGEDSNATTVNGNQADNSANGTGAAYVFVRSGTNWSQQAYLKASNAGNADELGTAVAVSGDTVVASAVVEDSGATGVNGDGSNNSANASGAAYVFDLDLDPWTDLGFSLAGISGPPSLVGTGTLVGGSATSVVLSNARPAALAVLFVGLASNPTAFKGGTLAPLPTLVTLSFTTSGAGAVVLPFNWPTGLPSGVNTFYQYAIKDAAAVQGVALSNALKATTP